MLKLWAKVLNGDKIIADTMYKKSVRYENGKMHEYLSEICHGFDIPTPVILKSHEKNFRKFNIARFKAVDFIEDINFTSFVVENASDDDK